MKNKNFQKISRESKKNQKKILKWSNTFLGHPPIHPPPAFVYTTLPPDALKSSKIGLSGDV